jgi:hypothetical protein
LAQRVGRDPVERTVERPQRFTQERRPLQPPTPGSPVVVGEGEEQ